MCTSGWKSTGCNPRCKVSGIYVLHLSCNKQQTLSYNRFCQVPTFGNGVIQTFASNTSEMKKLVAQDFEDILQVYPLCFTILLPDLLMTSLQCAIPVFEGLFLIDHDPIVQSLLYRFAQWHALAKLRIHSESTLGFFKDTFKDLLKWLRRFHDSTCAAFITVELLTEKVARQQKVHSACWIQ
jgi:hypothetical protein